MKKGSRLILAALVVLTGPSCDPPSPALSEVQIEVREVFERWLDAGAAGRMDLVLREMTTGYKSQWLFEMFDRGEHPALVWRRDLTGTPRTDVDLWLEASKSDTTGRVPRLPVSVLLDPSLNKLLFDILKAASAEVVREFGSYEITEVTPPFQNGVTVVVRNGQGKTEMYQMIVENARWMIDHHSNGPRSAR